MASALYHQNNSILAQFPHHNYSCFCYSSSIFFPLRTTHSSARLRINSSGDKNPNTLSQDDSRVNTPDPDPGPDTDLLSSLLQVFNFDGLGWEIMSIALPAALALAADPITSLVDTAFIGHLGSVELAAVGISVSVFNLISKLFNVPLLNVTTSFVAEEQALIAKDGSPDTQSKILLPSVATSILLALGLGVAEAVGLSVGSGFLMNTMGFTNACTS